MDGATVDMRHGEVFTICDETGQTITSAIVLPYEGGVQVIRVYTNPERRGEGHATEIMLKIVERHRFKDIFVVAEAYADKPLGNQFLQKWYESFDFVNVGDMMKRSKECSEGMIG